MVNRVILVGRLGKDPEMRYTAGGAPVTNFSLATNETWKDQSGERQERTEWHNIVVWNKLAETCNQYLSKGKLVYIEGRLQTREWDDRDGNKRRTTEVVASDMKMLERRSDAAPVHDAPTERPPAERPPAAKPMEPGITDDDIPF
ncbi:MAG: single-stranded DNA-binding protein [Acidobacteria bacterium]|nr:MAG: single-stranded DNA-binding protein [Acidobacteriota bacterium]